VELIDFDLTMACASKTHSCSNKVTQNAVYLHLWEVVLAHDCCYDLKGSDFCS